MIIAGNKIYETCPYCGKLIQINKKFIGSMHVCLSPQEREATRKQNIVDIKCIVTSRESLSENESGDKNGIITFETSEYNK